jgi:hypothetical protein
MARQIRFRPTIEMTNGELARELETVKAMQKRAEERPYAGTCGDDDALQDYRQELETVLKIRLTF